MLTLFVFGTVWFWALVALECIVLFALIEGDRVGWGTLSLIATFAILKFFGDVDIIGFAKANPLEFAAGVAGYFVAGTIWSVAKWWFFLKDRREKYDELKAEFLRNNGVQGTVIPEKLRAPWRLQAASLTDHRGYGSASAESIIPKARNHKGKILTWMTYWPWSMVWTLINDPVKKLFRQIYRSIQNLMQSISDRVFRGVEDDLREPPAPPPPTPTDEGEDAPDADNPRRGRSVGKMNG
jgi:hypothetical protein